MNFQSQLAGESINVVCNCNFSLFHKFCTHNNYYELPSVFFPSFFTKPHKKKEHKLLDTTRYNTTYRLTLNNNNKNNNNNELIISAYIYIMIILSYLTITSSSGVLFCWGHAMQDGCQDGCWTVVKIVPSSLCSTICFILVWLWIKLFVS
jgi:hypothetical protein